MCSSRSISISMHNLPLKPFLIRLFDNNTIQLLFKNAVLMLWFVVAWLRLPYFLLRNVEARLRICIEMTILVDHYAVSSVTFQLHSIWKWETSAGNIRRRFDKVKEITHTPEVTKATPTWFLMSHIIKGNFTKQWAHGVFSNINASVNHYMSFFCSRMWLQPT